MKAIIYKNYGPPEVAELAEIEKPIPKPDEVLLKVYATTANRTDSGFRSAQYFVSRFFTGLFRPKYQVLGNEFAGVIEEIGSNVSNFKVDDKIFGFNDIPAGGHAEYLTIKSNAGIALMPSNFNFEEAAPLAEGSHYALCNIRAAKVTAGQNVMVYGASGAIGSAAVQLLKYFNVHVTAVCNTKNVELIKSLGADIVIDYQTQDYTKTDRKFDFIFDAVGKSSFRKCNPILTEKGIYISTELGKGGENIFYALFTPILRGKRLLFPIPSMTQEDAVFIGELAEKGLFKPVIDRYYELEEIVEAYRYIETGQKTGNVVIKIIS